MRIGIDVGGTKTHAIALDDAGRIAAQARVATGRGAGGVLESTRSVIRELETATGTPTGGFESVGIGIPGIVDFSTGTVSHAVNLGFTELDLGRQLATDAAGRVRVDNDVNAAAFGAFRTLDGMPDSVAYLNVGTGLAAGVVVDGHLVRGSHGTAGEIGHIPVDPAGSVCTCGQRGCLETVASGNALSARWPAGGEQPIVALNAAADAGDAEAGRVRDALVDGIATAVQVLLLTLDTDLVLLGGGMMSDGAATLGRVRENLAARSVHSPFLASLHLPDRLRLAPPSSTVCAVGAALLASEDDPTHPIPRRTPMAKTAHTSDALPRPGGAYSHLVEANGFVYTAGFGPHDPATGVIPHGIAAQTEAVLRNLSTALGVVGLGLADVVKTTVHLADLGDFAEFDAAYSRIIPAPFPVRTTVGSTLRGMLVEIDAVAVHQTAPG